MIRHDSHRLALLAKRVGARLRSRTGGRLRLRGCGTVQKGCSRMHCHRCHIRGALQHRLWHSLCLVLRPH